MAQRIRIEVWITSFLVSCASWHQSEVLQNWDGYTQLAQAPLTCRAKLKLSADSDSENLFVDAQMLFHLNGKRSDLKIILLNPFHSPIASLDITPQRKSLSKDGKVTALESHSIFRHWYEPQWWNEIAFIFGKVTAASGPGILLNSHLQPTIFRHGNREIRCRYESSAARFPEVCDIKASGIEVKFNFSFSDCGSSL